MKDRYIVTLELLFSIHHFIRKGNGSPAHRAGLPGKVISFYIVPLDPAHSAGLAGHVPVIKRRSYGLQIGKTVSRLSRPPLWMDHRYPTRRTQIIYSSLAPFFPRFISLVDGGPPRIAMASTTPSWQENRWLGRSMPLRRESNS